MRDRCVTRHRLRLAGSPTLLILCFFSLCAAACEPSQGPVREWRPDDHQPPPTVADEGRAAPPGAGEGLPPEQRIAQALYAARCATCHGADGGGRGPGLPPGAPTPNFTDPSWQADQSDAALARSIFEGRGMMPAFRGQLSEQEVSLLVQVVRGFAGPAAAHAPQTGDSAASQGDEPPTN